MAIQGTQVPMYTNTLFLYFFYFSIFLFFMKNKIKQNWKQTNKNMLNNTKHKKRCKCMRKEHKKRRSIHGDNINVLAKEFKPFAIKRFGKQINLLIISVNELKSKSIIFNKLPNEVISNHYVFSFLVNKSVFWSLVWMNSRVRVPSSTSSRMKWYRIIMCLVWECWTGFLEMLMALVLS